MITVLDCLENTTLKYANNIICKDAKKEITFADFQQNAQAIGSFLCRYNVMRKPIAVFMDNTAEAWEAMLGVVYSGNFYVVIDALMPIERIKNIFNTLNPLAVIVDAKCAGQAAKLGMDIDIYMYGEIVKTSVNAAKLNAVRRRMIDTDPIYALFTSGSTGTPKGTVLTHLSVIKYTQWYAETFNITSKTIFGSQTPFYFSMSVSTMFSTIYTGAKLVVIPKQFFSFPVKLIEFMNNEMINTIYWVPSAMNMIANFKALDNHALPYLKTVLFAGEAMPTKQLNYWRQHLSKDVLYANLFGPTETTDIATYYIVNRDFNDDEPIPIGSACSNCDVFVLKNDGTLAGENEEGELCVRGSFLASGYYDNPEKTKEVFVQNPLNTHYPEIIYKTGDLVRYNDRGELVYITRKDFQIKHQGYRIELGEIETAASSVKGVYECACIYDKIKQLIVLYCTGENLTSKEILLGVRDKLPKYMMPNKIFVLESMPHNANGKIDKKLLQNTYQEKEKNGNINI